MSAPVADKALAERLAYWRGLELECEALGAGRGFRLEEALGQAYRSGQLITLAEAQAMVASERERCADLLDSISSGWGADALRFRGGTDPHHYRTNLASVARNHAAAIRAALAAIKEPKT
jgi:hypothetical protein